MNKEHPFMQLSAKSLCTFNKIQSVSVLSSTGKVRFLRQEKKKKHKTQVSVCPTSGLKGKDQHSVSCFCVKYGGNSTYTCQQTESMNIKPGIEITDYCLFVEIEWIPFSFQLDCWCLAAVEVGLRCHSGNPDIIWMLDLNMILLNPSCGANRNPSRHNHHLGPQTVSSLPDLTQMLPQKR